MILLLARELAKCGNYEPSLVTPRASAQDWEQIGDRIGNARQACLQSKARLGFFVSSDGALNTIVTPGRFFGEPKNQVDNHLAYPRATKLPVLPIGVIPLNDAIWLGMANLRPVLNVYYAERSSLKEISHVRYIPRDQSR